MSVASVFISHMSGDLITWRREHNQCLAWQELNTTNVTYLHPMFHFMLIFSWKSPCARVLAVIKQLILYAVTSDSFQMLCGIACVGMD